MTHRPPLISHPQITSSTLLNPLPPYFHTYVWPFLAAYPAFLSIYLPKESYNRYIQSSEWTYVYLGSIVTIQALLWLSTHWSINLRALSTTTKTLRVEDAKLIQVMPVANAGSPDICELIRDKVCLCLGGYFVVFHQLTAPAVRGRRRNLVSVPEKAFSL